VGVKRTSRWLEGESLIVSVAPVWTRWRGPLAVAVVCGVLGAGLTTVVHSWRPDRPAATAAAAAPAALVLVGRWWWHRRHRVHLTTLRIVEVRGLGRGRETSVFLADIARVELRQSFRGRLARRGHAVVITPAESIAFGPVRRPDALVRVIDRQRLAASPTTPPVDDAWGLPDAGPELLSFDRAWRQRARRGQKSR
jgi:hypothetical protein